MSWILLRLSVAILCFLLGLTSDWLVRALISDGSANLSSSERLGVDPAPVVARRISEENEAVYEVVLEHNFVEEGVKLLVIQDQTTGYPMYEDPKLIKEFWQDDKSFFDLVRQGIPDAQTETLRNYLEQNQTSQKFAMRSKLSIKYVLVGDKGLEDLFQKDKFDRGWAAFYARYPHSSGLIFLSKVGFNANFTQAMLYAGRQCGGLCGSGSYLLLGKHDGKWVMERTIGLWVS
jgi:hypothetical protein